MPFFFFGLLRDKEILELVIGRPVAKLPFVPARLPGARLARLRGQTYPMLVAAGDRWVEGDMVDGLTEADMARIVFFESVEYEPKPVEAHLTSGEIAPAHAFATTSHARHDDEEWRFADWLSRHKTEDVRIAALWMSLHGRLDVVEADRRWEEALAASRPLEDLVREICGVRRRAVR